MPRKISQSEFKEKLKQVHNNEIIALEEYINSREKILFKHEVCGTEWKAVPHSLLNGHGCPKCSGKMKKNTSQFKKEVYDLVKDEYSVLGEYKNNSTKIKFKHNLCGKTFYMIPKAFLNGQRCPYEAKDRSSESNSITQGNPELKNKLIKEECIKRNYDLIKGYKRANINLLLRCNECGELYSVKPYHFLKNNSNCKCRHRSKGEKCIENWLKSNNFNYKIEYTFNDCYNEKQLYFDFAVLDKNDKAIFLIEFDGSQHYNIKYTKRDYLMCVENDNIKNDYCKLKNIPLIRIKYNRSIKYFEEKIINELEEKIKNLNMPIPCEA